MHTGTQSSHTHFNVQHTRRPNQSFKVSEASISFCKSATIRQWVLFSPLSVDVGLWPEGRRLFIAFVSASVDSQPLIYGSRLIESSTGLQICSKAAKLQGHNSIGLLRALSPLILNVSQFLCFLLLFFSRYGQIKINQRCKWTWGSIWSLYQ